MGRFSLATKLAFVLSSLSLALVLIIMLLVKASFDRGFERYINQSIRARMELLGEHLNQSPEELQALVGNPRRWERYLRVYFREIRSGGGGEAAGMESGQRLRTDLPRLHFFHRNVWLLGPDRQLPERVRESAPELIYLPLGDSRPPTAYLAWRVIKPRDNPLDAHFAAEQHRLFFGIAVAAVLISCLLAWPLSRYLINPVRRLSVAMGQLTRRDYTGQVPVSSNDELGDLSRDFNLMAQALQEQDRQQRQWLADISHELRTPLGVMKGELEAMEDGLLPLDQDRVKSLNEEVNQLTRLVDDLHQLAITQVSHLRYEWQRIELKEFLQKLAERFAPLLQQAQLSWEYEASDGLWIMTDGYRLEQLFMNLVQNSARYTDPGGRIKVTLRGGNTVTMVWEDSAPGVAPEDLPHLFEHFYRVEHSRQRALGGSGLGLSIVANIANAHGASVSAGASDFGGLRITVNFPRADHFMSPH